VGCEVVFPKDRVLTIVFSEYKLLGDGDAFLVIDSFVLTQSGFDVGVVVEALQHRSALCQQPLAGTPLPTGVMQLFFTFLFVVAQTDGILCSLYSISAHKWNILVRRSYHED